MGLPQENSGLYGWMLNSWNTIGTVNGRTSSQQLVDAKQTYSAYPSYFSAAPSSATSSTGTQGNQYKLPDIFNDNVLIRRNPIPQAPVVQTPQAPKEISKWDVDIT